MQGVGASDDRVRAAVVRTFSRLSRQTGVPMFPTVVKSGGTLEIVVESRDHKGPQRLGDDERYSLEVRDGRVRLSADAPLGVLRGLETFLQSVTQNTSGMPGFSVPEFTVHDGPRYPWRGLSLDVSRHFVPTDDVKRTLDGMAAVKLNVFHWHLSDDQGFRVESKRFPRLQAYGSDGLFYTQAEIRDVVAYARARGIRVVPEFDMPGHAASWTPGYPNLATTSGPHEILRGFGITEAVLDPTKESTYRFIDGLVGEMSKLFPDEFFHIGGDEVNPKQWNQSGKIQAFMRKHHLANSEGLQAYFNGRLLKILTKHGKQMEGWDEVLNPDLPKSVVIQSWRGQESLWQAAAEGYRTLLSAGYYLDLMQPASQHYAIDPLVLPPARAERLQKQNKPIPPPPTPATERNILGGEAAMWEELATAENLDSRLWPRLAAIAERFWSPQSVTDVHSMYERLAMTNGWLEWLGLTQRSNLELMRQRLAGGERSPALDAFASALEPVKGYGRHAGRYLTSTPLNRLVDAIPPESDAARAFNNDVDAFVASDRSQPAKLIEKLSFWQAQTEAVLPLLQSRSLLNDAAPAAQTLLNVCRYGQMILRHETVDSAAASAALTQAETSESDLLVAIAPGIRRLIEAPAVSASNRQ